MIRLYVKHEFEKYGPHIGVVRNVAVDSGGLRPLDWAWPDGLGSLYDGCAIGDEGEMECF